MKRKILAITLVAALVVCFVPTQSTFGTKNIKKKKQQLNKVTKQKDDISEELGSMKVKVLKKKRELSDMNASIKNKTELIKQSQAALEETRKDIGKRKTGLNKRLRTMYKSGSIGYLNVILGSNSVEELVTNVDFVQKIFTNDQSILTELKAQKREIEEKETKLLAEKKSLQKDLDKASETKKDLDKVKAKLQSRFDELEKTENSLKKAIAEASSNSGVKTPTGKWAFPLRSGYTLTGHYLEQRSYERHPGVDLAVPTGTPIYAAQSGKVITAGWYGGYGMAVVINHGAYTSVYGHNSSLSVSVGQYVRKGQHIANAGSTGWSTGSHLHFEVRNSAGQHISPAPFIGVA
ncbi:MAG: peptidoglycan DD-metalloendopeptidase family protein [Hornefia sp.]|nr:peptidoglycan DD-metalloendopeptidase family protein [Hornefia sp.]